MSTLPYLATIVMLSWNRQAMALDCLMLRAQAFWPKGRRPLQDSRRLRASRPWFSTMSHEVELRRVAVKIMVFCGEIRCLERGGESCEQAVSDLRLCHAFNGRTAFFAL